MISARGSVATAAPKAWSSAYSVWYSAGRTCSTRVGPGSGHTSAVHPAWRDGGAGRLQGGDDRVGGRAVDACPPRAQVRPGVDPAAADPPDASRGLPGDPEVQVGRDVARVAGVADPSEQLAGLDSHPGSDAWGDRGEVGAVVAHAVDPAVDRDRQAAAVAPAVAARVPAVDGADLVDEPSTGRRTRIPSRRRCRSLGSRGGCGRRPPGNRAPGTRSGLTRSVPALWSPASLRPAGGRGWSRWPRAGWWRGRWSFPVARCRATVRGRRSRPGATRQPRHGRRGKRSGAWNRAFLGALLGGCDRRRRDDPPSAGCDQ